MDGDILYQDRIEGLGFTDYLLRVCAKSPATARAYERDVAAFTAFCRARGLTATALSRTRAALYLVSRTEERQRHEADPTRLSARSAARVVSALKAYGQYLVFRGAVDENPMAGLQAPKYARALPPYFNLDEIRTLVSSYDDQPGPLGVRNAALLRLLYATGLRVQECASLDMGSLRLEERFVRTTGKGNRERRVPYGKTAAAALHRYLATSRPALACSSKGQALWLNRRGTRLSARGIQDVLRRAALAAGCLKPLSPHKLRHACATHLMEGGADIRVVQELLGHESLNTTQVYTQVTRTRLREVYRRTHPRAKR